MLTDCGLPSVADYSNWGPSVDLYAPGTAVTSNWIGNTTAQNTLTGTSMVRRPDTVYTTRKFTELVN